MKISDITGDVMTVLTLLWTVKPYTARPVRQRISTVMKMGRGPKLMRL